MAAPLPPTPARRAAYAAAAVLACLLWSSAFPAAKIGLAHVPPLTFAGLRFVLAGLLLLPLCGRPGALLAAIRSDWRLMVRVSILQTSLLYGTFFAGMAIVSGAQGAVVIGAAPLASAVLAHFFMHDDRITWGRALTIALGMAGVAVLALGAKPWGPAGLRELGGLGLLMVGVVSSAASGIAVARTDRRATAVQLNAAQMTLGGLVLLALSVPIHGLPAAPPPGAFYIALLWLATVSAVGFSIWFFLLKRVRVSELNMWKFLVPGVGAALSWLIVPGEHPTWPTAAGAVIVTAAVLLTQWQTVRRAA